MLIVFLLVSSLLKPNFRLIAVDLRARRLSIKEPVLRQFIIFFIFFLLKIFSGKG